MTLTEWAKDFPSAGTFLPLLLAGDTIAAGCCNDTMMGASRAELRKYGYTVDSVPSADVRIQDCQRQLFQAQVQCWASLDQYLSADVVPFVPLTQNFSGWAVSSRVRDFTVDSDVGIPIPSLGAITVEGPSPVPAPTLAEPLPLSEIPDGIYTTTITAAELDAFGPVFDPDYRDQLAGTYTIRLEGGRFSTVVARDGYTIYDPMTAGSYSGAGDRIVFAFEAPAGVAHAASPLRWREDGGTLRFTLARCTGEAARYPDECALQTALFTGAPWVPVGG